MAHRLQSAFPMAVRGTICLNASTRHSLYQSWEHVGRLPLL